MATLYTLLITRKPWSIAVATLLISRKPRLALPLRSVPIPIVSAAAARRKLWRGKEQEIELSESYTCVISHVGSAAVRKRVYFDDGAAHYCWGSCSAALWETPPASVRPSLPPPAEDFLSRCFRCRKKLHDIDIFMYRASSCICISDLNEDKEMAVDHQLKVWFKNRRARWKSKQLEKEYGRLKAMHDDVLLQKCRLEAEGDELGRRPVLSCFLAFTAERDLDWGMWALQGSYYWRRKRSAVTPIYAWRPRTANPRHECAKVLSIFRMHRLPSLSLTSPVRSSHAGPCRRFVASGIRSPEVAIRSPGANFLELLCTAPQ
ncbi:hypothetical protein Taro_025650 [Colocasia esculenta]|uniref:Homeobox domain-containing protein n=1 Tax=Colocasia esculenta TaxID=4460 RepID=A0A843VCU8_COLES|nr:hypothetical protein [Colocasia esculenta]